MNSVVKLSEKVAQELISSKCFKTNVHKLANRLHISDLDAQQEIYYHLTNKRLKNMTEDEFVEKWNDEKERKVIEWKITYSRQDVQHSYYADRNREDDKVSRLKVMVPTDKDIQNMSEPLVIQYVDDDKQKLINTLMDNLKLIFPKSKTKAEMIDNIVNHKKQYSSKEINALLSDVRKACRKKKTNVDHIYNLATNQENIKQLRVINAILNIEKSNQTLSSKNNQINIIIQNNQDIINLLIDECMEWQPMAIKKPKQILEWMNASTNEQITLLDYLEIKRKWLMNKVGGCNENA